jgi:hypothetical protein
VSDHRTAGDPPPVPPGGGRGRGRRWAGGLSAALAFVALGREAQAQDAATAQALYEEGQSALAAGNVLAACNKFDASHRLIPTTVNLGALAACHERLGRTASAAGEYERLAGDYRLRGKPDKEREARAKAAALETKIPKLTVHLSPEARLVPGLEISRDDGRLESALLETALPVDPGSHTVTAKAPGFTTWVTVVEVATGNELKEITVPGLVRHEAKGAPGAPTGPGTSAPSGSGPTPIATGPSGAPPPAVEPSGFLTKRQRLGLYVGAPGVVLLGVGAALGFRTYQRQSDARDLCPRTQCGDTRAIDLNDSARATYPFALGATVLGAAATGVGTYFFFSKAASTGTSTGAATSQAKTSVASPSASKPSVDLNVRLSVAPGLTGFAASGSF